MVQVIGKFRLKVGVNGMENCKGNGKTVKPLGRSEALLPMKVLHCHQVQLDCFIGDCVG